MEGVLKLILISRESQVWHKLVSALISGFDERSQQRGQCLSQDSETGCLKLADFVKFLGVQIFKGDHNILIFQP